MNSFFSCFDTLDFYFTGKISDFNELCIPFMQQLQNYQLGNKLLYSDNNKRLINLTYCMYDKYKPNNKTFKLTTEMLGNLLPVREFSFYATKKYIDIIPYETILPDVIHLHILIDTFNINLEFINFIFQILISKNKVLKSLHLEFNTLSPYHYALHENIVKYILQYYIHQLVTLQILHIDNYLYLDHTNWFNVILPNLKQLHTLCLNSISIERFDNYAKEKSLIANKYIYCYERTNILKRILNKLYPKINIL